MVWFWFGRKQKSLALAGYMHVHTGESFGGCCAKRWRPPTSLHLLLLIFILICFTSGKGVLQWLKDFWFFPFSYPLHIFLFLISCLFVSCRCIGHLAWDKSRDNTPFWYFLVFGFSLYHTGVLDDAATVASFHTTRKKVQLSFLVCWWLLVSSFPFLFSLVIGLGSFSSLVHLGFSGSFHSLFFFYSR